MNEISLELLQVLYLILPGLVATVIFYSLTSHPLPGNLERVIYALIFTALAKVCTDLVHSLLGTTYYSLSVTQLSHWEALIPIGVGIVIGLLTVWFVNHDVLHRFFRWIGLSLETSYPSEWYASFANNSSCYVVLHLKDGRRFYGWPKEWPSNPSSGYSRISEGEWLDVTSNQEPVERLQTEIFSMVIPNEIVEMVEFVDATIQETEDVA